MQSILELSEIPGFRTPLGHTHGLKDFPETVEVISRAGFRYVSSDIRCAKGGIEPPLNDEAGNPRLPYRYPNGLLEVPSHGWHDTAYGGESRTPYFTSPPKTHKEIVDYYQQLIEEAGLLADELGGFSLTLVMHPIEAQKYADDNFYRQIKSSCEDADGEFLTYEEIADRVYPNPD